MSETVITYKPIGIIHSEHVAVERTALNRELPNGHCVDLAGITMPVSPKIGRKGTKHKE